jgi:riboflavin kinase/FMN adenylyltransferase
MRTFRRRTKAIQNSVITIGSFDGIHQGHQVVIKKTIELARFKNKRAGIVTFEPSPQQVIYPDFHYILTPVSEKKEILSKLGADFLFLIEFNKSIQALTPAGFIQSQILSSLHPSTIVVGYDHQFGKDAQGDVKLLKNLAQEFNFELIIEPEFKLDGEPVKSTRIRERLLLGDMKIANHLLGRNYSIQGSVTKGLGIGKRIGFPTVNLKVNEIEKLIPADGVYAVLVWYRDKSYLGAMNIGIRPTFHGEKRTIEASLINIKSNLYGAKLKIELVARIRPERKFSNPLNLAQQIKKDIEHAKVILERH